MFRKSNDAFRHCIVPIQIIFILFFIRQFYILLSSIRFLYRMMINYMNDISRIYPQCYIKYIQRSIHKRYYINCIVSSSLTRRIDTRFNRAYSVIIDNNSKSYNSNPSSSNLNSLDLQESKFILYNEDDDIIELKFAIGLSKYNDLFNILLQRFEEVKVFKIPNIFVAIEFIHEIVVSKIPISKFPNIINTLNDVTDFSISSKQVNQRYISMLCNAFRIHDTNTKAIVKVMIIKLLKHIELDGRILSLLTYGIHHKTKSDIDQFYFNEVLQCFNKYKHINISTTDITIICRNFTAYLIMNKGSSISQKIEREEYLNTIVLFALRNFLESSQTLNGEDLLSLCNTLLYYNSQDSNKSKELVAIITNIIILKTNGIILTSYQLSQLCYLLKVFSCNDINIHKQELQLYNAISMKIKDCLEQQIYFTNDLELSYAFTSLRGFQNHTSLQNDLSYQTYCLCLIQMIEKSMIYSNILIHHPLHLHFILKGFYYFHAETPMEELFLEQLNSFISSSISNIRLWKQLNSKDISQLYRAFSNIQFNKLSPSEHTHGKLQPLTMKWKYHIWHYDLQPFRHDTILGTETLLLNLNSILSHTKVTFMNENEIYEALNGIKNMNINSNQRLQYIKHLSRCLSKPILMNSHKIAGLIFVLHNLTGQSSIERKIIQYLSNCLSLRLQKNYEMQIKNSFTLHDISLMLHGIRLLSFKSKEEEELLCNIGQLFKEIVNQMMKEDNILDLSNQILSRIVLSFTKWNGRHEIQQMIFISLSTLLESPRLQLNLNEETSSSLLYGLMSLTDYTSGIAPYKNNTTIESQLIQSIIRLIQRSSQVLSSKSIIKSLMFFRLRYCQSITDILLIQLLVKKLNESYSNGIRLNNRQLTSILYGLRHISFIDELQEQYDELFEVIMKYVSDAIPDNNIHLDIFQIPLACYCLRSRDGSYKYDKIYIDVITKHILHFISISRDIIISHNPDAINTCFFIALGYRGLSCMKTNSTNDKENTFHQQQLLQAYVDYILILPSISMRFSSIILMLRGILKLGINEYANAIYQSINSLFFKSIRIIYESNRLKLLYIIYIELLKSFYLIQDVNTILLHQDILLHYIKSLISLNSKNSFQIQDYLSPNEYEMILMKQSYRSDILVVSEEFNKHKMKVFHIDKDLASSNHIPLGKTLDESINIIEEHIFEKTHICSIREEFVINKKIGFLFQTIESYIRDVFPSKSVITI